MTVDGEVLGRAVLDAALDCVICMDEHGRVTYFNASAQRTFGYSGEEAVGRDLADAIVPSELREAHRRGLAHFASTGEAPILGERLELTAMRADGSQFPAELTVTRLAPPNGPGFIGFVRDITERLSAEADLQAARARSDAIAAEQAALRRVATLVARQASLDGLFDAVGEEVQRLLGARGAGVVREGEGRLESDASAVPIVVDGAPWGAIAVYGVADEPPATEGVATLQAFAELVAIGVANSATRSELVEARRRVIEAADAARARVTRDMHDGAQQRFVNSLINLQLAQDKWASDGVRAHELLAAGVEETGAGLGLLRELAAGLHPTILNDLGLEAALEGLTARSPIVVDLDVDETEVPAALRTNVYFLCSEALTNVVKHSGASEASMHVGVADGWLTVEVRDDGVGGAEIGSGGSGLLGLSDRVGALEGSLTISSPVGHGTTLTARVPCRQPADPGTR
jgi:PAS domain S-box-containing protein